MTAGEPVLGTEHPPVGVETVEALVRRQLADSLGGRRGILEAAIPGLVFTLVWLPTKELKVALVASLLVAVAALVVRVVQKGPTQYVFNAIFSIAIGWIFVRLAASSGGDANDQALAYFLPGILMSLGYTVVLGASCLVRWPMLGFMLGAATEDPFGWHDNPQVVRLCSRLTWVMLLPGAVGALLQGPVWLLAHEGSISTGTAVAVIAALRLGLGWALRIGSWVLMIWLLARNATPLQAPTEA
jgi:energy-coupling factor transporter transmembrane protein EcfT